MSLLLDALKKAAEEKKRQEKEKNAEAANAETGNDELRLMDTDSRTATETQEVSGTHPKVFLDESIDEWSLEDDVLDTPVQADATLTSFTKQQEAIPAQETVSLTQNMQNKAAAYQGSPVKAAHLFSNQSANATADRRKIILLVMLVAAVGLVGLLYGYDYITSLSDERAAHYRPIRSLSSSPVASNDNNLRIQKAQATVDPIILVEQENYDALLGVAKQSEPAVAQAETRNAAKIKKAAPIPARKRLSISRQAPRETVHDILMAGFNAFQQADYETAITSYQKALQKESDNRDALLGMAAIAIVKNDYSQARDYYAKLLRLDPRDTHASAGLNNLLSMENNTDNSVDRESQLKKLLEQKPNAHELHYALGALYATQQQWAQAQQYYFAAFRLQPENADYAYNLAVSLDHLGQKPAAIQFYQVAMHANEVRRGMFNSADVVERIAIIQNEKAR